MKAVNINGKITIHASVPSTLVTSTGTYLNAPAMSDAELRNAGLFDVIIEDRAELQIN